MKKDWRHAFRAIAPDLPTEGLQALVEEIRTHGDRLCQQSVTQPKSPYHGFEDDTPEKACVIGFCGWQGLGLHTVGQVHAYYIAFGQTSHKEIVDFVDWWDSLPSQALGEQLLLAEVERELHRRKTIVQERPDVIPYPPYIPLQEVSA